MPLKVSSSPHIRHQDTTSGIMLDVIIALIPLGIAGVVMYGPYTLLVIAVSVAAAVAGEYLWCLCTKKPRTLSDLSAIVTGLLLSYNLPPTIPLWMAALGSLIAIIIVKQMFGGLGHNFANPAITARIVLMVSFPAAMTSFIPALSDIDAVTSATPLKEMGMKWASEAGSYDIVRLFLGNYPGCIGETSALLILAGGLYLVLRRVISPTIPLCFCGSAFLLTFALTGDAMLSLAGILSGGLMLGAMFMATDYVTSPSRLSGQIIFGIGCGVITVLIRMFANLPEGVSYSILIMNLLVPLINKIPAKKPFGWEAAK